MIQKAWDMEEGAKHKYLFLCTFLSSRIADTARNAKDTIVNKAWDLEGGVKKTVVGVVEGVKDTARHAKDAVVHKARNVEEEAKDKYYLALCG